MSLVTCDCCDSPLGDDGDVRRLEVIDRDQGDRYELSLCDPCVDVLCGIMEIDTGEIRAPPAATETTMGDTD